LKLRCDEPLSTFVIKIYLRQYDVAYRNGASPYTLLMIAQMMGLGGGGRGRRGMGRF